ncbi:MAG: sulfite exporter TauE/SafE family protein [Bacteroidetes bacterium]|nr:sulfite exporter TauE/SafE family protein [Bacteroidota bacterium]MCB0844547.1 sulfite exporter TauE/SafE family protein [Bacteroidota bacterium]
MTDFFAEFQLSTLDWVLFFIAGAIIGMSKTGVAGVSYIVIPIMVFIFGAKPSTGLLLPILSLADIFAVSYYRRSADWHHIIKLMPIAIIGVLLGTIFGEYISAHLFKISMGIIVLIGIVVMLVMERRKNKAVPSHWFFSTGTGLFAGFSTMIGNAAGSIMAVYMLSMRMPKNIFIGTTAWFFMILNLTKFPSHIFVWKTITFKSLLLDLTVLPGIALGAYLGFIIVKRIPERAYRYFVLIVTILSAFLLFI